MAITNNSYQQKKLLEAMPVIWSLRQEGYSIRGIAKAVKVSKNTIWTFLKTEEYKNFNHEHGGLIDALGMSVLVSEKGYDAPDLSRKKKMQYYRVTLD